MKILSLDCSTTSTGWAIFDNTGLCAYGVIKPDGSDWRDRLVHQGPKLKEVIDTYHPDRIVMEDVPLKAGNSKVLVILGAVQGYVLGIAASHGLPVQFVFPSEWRSKLGLYDGTKEGEKRPVLKQRAIEFANNEFGLNLKWVSPSSKMNDDDLAEAVLIGYSVLKGRKNL